MAQLSTFSEFMWVISWWGKEKKRWVTLGAGATLKGIIYEMSNPTWPVGPRVDQSFDPIYIKVIFWKEM